MVAASLARVLSFLSRFGWAIVVLILGAFVWFTIEISKPVEGTLSDELVVGTVHAGRALASEGPFLEYVALYQGPPTAERPEYPLDDQLAKTDGSFALSADAIDGRTFHLLARIETAREELFCKLVPLPEVRLTGDGWVAAETGRPLLPRQIVVDRSQPCSF